MAVKRLCNMACKVVVLLLLVYTLFGTVAALQGPERVLHPTDLTITAGVGSANGSLQDSGCTGIFTSTPMSYYCMGLNPGTPGGNTSYLVDGIVPELPDIENDQSWANQLTTVQHGGVTTEFSLYVYFSRANATNAKVVLFNCREWGIGVVAIIVQTTVTSKINGTVQTTLEIVGSTMLQDTSCDSLQTVSIPLRSTGLAPTTFYTIIFHTGSSIQQWTHIAEVAFYNDSSAVEDDSKQRPDFATVVGLAVALPVGTLLLLIVLIILTVLVLAYRAHHSGGSYHPEIGDNALQTPINLYDDADFSEDIKDGSKEPMTQADEQDRNEHEGTSTFKPDTSKNIVTEL